MRMLRQFLSILTLGLVSSRGTNIKAVNKIPATSPERNHGHSSVGYGSSKRFKKMTGNSPQAKARRKAAWLDQVCNRWKVGGTMSWDIKQATKYRW